MSSRSRLSRSRDFDAVYRKGRSAASRTLVVYVFRHQQDDDLVDAEGIRLGLAVPRRVGDAVARNHVKRKLREAFAEAGADLEPAHDVVIVGRPGLAEALDRENHAWLVEELRALLARTAASAGAPA